MTEAALLGSAIEHGVSPDLIVLSDSAKQFAILVHALCWVHRSLSIRRLNGVTAQQRQEIEQVQDTLWAYYRELKAYQEQPTPQESARLEARKTRNFWAALSPSLWSEPGDAAVLHS